MNGGLRSAVWVGFDGSGYIYVSDAGLDQVRVYAPGASGDAAPVRIIPLTGPGCALSVDKAGYVFATVLVDGFDCGARVMVYAPGAGLGPTVTLPIHTIVTTANEYLSDIVIDGAGELYIETAGEVWYYEDPINRWQSPTRIIHAESFAEYALYPPIATEASTGDLYFQAIAINYPRFWWLADHASRSFTTTSPDRLSVSRECSENGGFGFEYALAVNKHYLMFTCEGNGELLVYRNRSGAQRAVERLPGGRGLLLWP